VGSNTPQKNQLEQLRMERDAKFERIVSCLSRELYSKDSPISEEDRKYLVEEAEELTDNWAAAVANRKLPLLSTALQLLLSEHQEICKRIIDLLDNGQSDN
jgi:hypothetical protein